MHLRGFLTIGSALLACAAGTLPQHVLAGTTDAVFISSGASTAQKETAPYDSEYAAAERDMGNGFNTPEADARPGEYYFLLAVHAYSKKDFAFAVQMYEVAAAWAYKPAEYNLAIMYARGQGVAADLPRGLAWMAIAPEAFTRAWRGLLVLSRGLRRGMALFEQRYYLAGLLIAVILVIMLFIQ